MAIKIKIRFKEDWGEYRKGEVIWPTAGLRLVLLRDGAVELVEDGEKKPDPKKKPGLLRKVFATKKKVVRKKH